MKDRKPRGPGRPNGTPAETVHPHFPPGKVPAANCACRDPDSTARFTVTINDATMCSWCGGDMALLKGTP